MNPTKNLPRPVAWVTRVVAYAIFGVIALAILNACAQRRLADNALACMNKGAAGSQRVSALEHAKALITCLERDNGVLENLLMRSFSKPVSRLPNTPCKYVGTWLATRPLSVYRISLQDNGEFIAEPAQAAADAHTYVGSWGFHDGRMIWITEGIWPPDVNPIRNESEGAFMLVERDGSQTEFSLFKRLETNECSR